MNSKISLIAILLFSIAAAALAILSIRAPLLDLLIAIPMVFIFPGWTLTKALFPGKVLSTSDQILFGLGLSLTLAILGGLVLNLIPAGLQRTPWMVLLSSVTLIASIVALIREWKQPGSKESPGGYITFSLKSALLLLGAILIVGGSLWFTIFEVNSQNPSPFTQLWALEDKNDPSIIHIGVQSEEKETLQYKLIIIRGDQLILEPVIVKLMPQEKWEMTIQLIEDNTISKHDIRVELYRLDQPETVYRQVFIRRTK